MTEGTIPLQPRLAPLGEDSVVYFSGLENELMAQWRRKSRNSLYRRDPEAWLWDVLGFRWHKKQREFVWDFVESRRVAVKSANGTGKSRGMGELETWGICTHEPGELLIITTGPTLRQIEEVTFAYLAQNYGRAKARGFAPPGYLTNSARWNHQADRLSKAKTLVLGQRPSDSDIVGTFQGIRAVGEEDAKTWVVIDEGGAVPDDLYVAAEAVTTGAGDNKICTIGNPDRIGTYFQKIFEDDLVSVDWKTHTISAFDLPTFTGEIVYDDPELQRQMLESGMVDRAWVEQKERAWGKDSARYRSKVLGEFPEGDDWCFFSQYDINMAEETDIDISEVDPRADRILGVDYADGGDDDSKAYLNVAGRVRHQATWSDGNINANRTHEIALKVDANIVVMDAIGVGAGPSREIVARSDRHYTAIRAKASERSPDPARWADYRAYWYDMLREGMRRGEVDLDFYAVDENGEPIGKNLKDQLLSIRYDFNAKGAIKIEPKKEARKRGISSPDDLDAIAFAVGVKARELLDDPLSGRAVGDVMLEDPWEDPELATMAGMPI